MKKLLVTLLPIVVSISCSSVGKSASNRAIQTGNVDFKRIVEDGEPPALAVRKIVNGKITNQFIGGRRSLQFEEMVNADDEWHLGSNVKPMTSYLIGTLIDQGKFTLDTRVSKLLPGYIPPGSGFERVRVRDLLSHRAGLTEMHELRDVNAWADAMSSREPTRKKRERLVKAILSEAPKFPAGAKYEYSNSGYLVLGEIIEVVTKQPWEQILTDRLFKPLGMNGCKFEVPNERGASPPEQPWGHTESDGRLISVQPPALTSDQFDRTAANGPTGVLYCDVESWTKFLEEMLESSHGRSKILRRQTAREYFNEIKDGMALGGWGAKAREWASGMSYTMSGSNGLNYALFVIAPEENTIILAATNLGTENGLKAMMEAVKPISR